MSEQLVQLTVGFSAFGPLSREADYAARHEQINPIEANRIIQLVHGAAHEMSQHLQAPEPITQPTTVLDAFAGLQSVADLVRLDCKAGLLPEASTPKLIAIADRVVKATQSMIRK